MNGRGGPKDAQSSLQVALSKVQLPAKKYFKIGEVAHLVGVEPHVLRYWQTQFPQVRPQKSRSGHRLYRRKDVETLLSVKELLHVQRFTIAGARQALRQSAVQSDIPSEVESELSSLVPAVFDDESNDADLDDDDIVDDYDVGIAASDVMPMTEVELVGVDGSELRAALETELHASSGRAMEVVELHEEDPTIPPASSTLDGAVGTPSLTHLVSSSTNRIVTPQSPADPRALETRAADVVQVRVHGAVPARDGNGHGGANGNGHALVGTELEARARAARTETHVVERRPSERAQLGFGFSPTTRAALAEARDELRDVLRTLDAFVPVDRRRGGTGRR
jgi:DNA-binding transcriptional MerR regulator